MLFSIDIEKNADAEQMFQEPPKVNRRNAFYRGKLPATFFMMVGHN